MQKDREEFELEMTVEELIKDIRAGKPHVVILGAGASAAAFPNGDKNGNKLPLTLICDSSSFNVTVSPIVHILSDIGE